MNYLTEPPRRLLTLQEVLERVRMSKSQLYRAIRERRFPKPKKFGRLSYWFTADIEGFIDGLIAQSGTTKV